jgi:hypothetical protein
MSQDLALLNFNSEVRRGSPLLWWTCVAMTIGMMACFSLQYVDAQLLAGVSVWEKPAKFFLSLIVQAATVAWAISLLPKPARGVKTATWLFVAALLIEMVYMIYRASRGEASHFNVSTTFAAIMYTVMGVGSLALVGTSAFVGWRVWQQRGVNLMREAAGVGLMLGALLGTIAGDLTGLGFFHWSTTGGDLRVAHFIGLHAAQAVPLAALIGRRGVVYAAAALCTAMMFAAFASATMGTPIFKG